MPLFTLIGMNHEAYSGLIARFTGGEPAVVNASVKDLERLMLEEDSRRLAMGISIPTAPSAQRADGTPGAKTPTPAPPSNPRRPAPRNDPEEGGGNYPPDNGIPWRVVKAIHRGKKSCLYCHSRKKFHWEKGCPALGACGLIVKEDKAAADKLMALWTE
jgi:hypothetical protein